jgi:hypothetical protein
MQYNVVDSPAGALPVTRVNPATDTLPEGFWSRSKSYCSILSKGCEGIYDAGKMAGLPVGVQVSVTNSIELS